MKDNGKWLDVFAWEGTAADGKKMAGLIQATSAASAQNSLLRHHIHILAIKKQRQRRILRRFSASHQAVFFNQLATLLQAGVPLLQTLAMTCTSESCPLPSAIYLTLRDEVMAGNGLAAGLEQFPYYFDALICQLVRAGEKSGTLDTLLSRIALHTEQMNALQRRLVRICLYPIVTLVTALGISLFMLMVVAPRFGAIFEEMHVPLPAYTRTVLLAGNLLRHYFFPIIGFMLAAALWSVLSGKTARRRGQTQFWLHLPVIGTLLQKSISARFTRTLATLLAAGIPLTSALSMTAPATGSRTAEKAIRALQQNINNGQQLHQAMQHQRFFSPLMRQMVEAGEESGTLVKMLEKLSSLLEADVAHYAGLASQLLEPLIMVIPGALIGALIIAMYLPIFKLGNII